jgi:hypothetical protein
MLMDFFDWVFNGKRMFAAILGLAVLKAATLLGLDLGWGICALGLGALGARHIDTWEAGIAVRRGLLSTEHWGAFLVLHGVSLLANAIAVLMRYGGPLVALLVTRSDVAKCLAP